MSNDKGQQALGTGGAAAIDGREHGPETSTAWYCKRYKRGTGGTVQYSTKAYKSSTKVHLGDGVHAEV